MLSETNFLKSKRKRFEIRKVQENNNIDNKVTKNYQIFFNKVLKTFGYSLSNFEQKLTLIISYIVSVVLKLNLNEIEMPMSWNRSNNHYNMTIKTKISQIEFNFKNNDGDIIVSNKSNTSSITIRKNEFTNVNFNIIEDNLVNIICSKSLKKYVEQIVINSTSENSKNFVDDDEKKKEDVSSEGSFYEKHSYSSSEDFS